MIYKDNTFYPSGAFFEPLPLPLKPIDFEFAKVRDMAFIDLVNSFRIPAVLIKADMEYSYAWRRTEELRRDIMDQKLQKLSDELLGSMLGVPAGHLAWKDICTTSSSTTQNTSFDKLRETLGNLLERKAPASFKLVSSTLMSERKQFRFPKSKKKRIRKKWSKRESNYRYEPMKQYYIINDTIYAHPSVIKKIKEGILTMSPNGLVEDQV